MVLILSFHSESQEDRYYNNADSFAIAFDKAWETKKKQEGNVNIETNELLKYVLESVKEHPFYVNSPDNALKVALFRIRLLSLK